MVDANWMCSDDLTAVVGNGPAGGGMAEGAAAAGGDMAAIAARIAADMAANGATPASVAAMVHGLLAPAATIAGVGAGVGAMRLGGNGVALGGNGADGQFPFPA
jgi:hypothetical protein